MGGEDAAAVAAPRIVLPCAEPSLVSVTPLAVLTGHEDRVWSVAWHPTAPILASCSADKTVRLWSCTSAGGNGGSESEETKRTWRCIHVLEGEHSGTVRHVAWSPSGEYLACASFDKTVSIWRKSSEQFEMEVESVLDGHESEVKHVAWVTDSTLASCARDRNVWIWDRIDEGEYECAGILSGHSQDVKACAWVMPPPTCSSLEDDADEQTKGQLQQQVVSCGYDDAIKVWEETGLRDDWQCVQTLHHHTGTVWDISVQPLEDTDSVEEAQAGGEEKEEGPSPGVWPLLCSCSDDKTVALWARGKGKKYARVASISGISDRTIYAAQWAPSGTPLIACACGDNRVVILAAYKDDSADGHVHLRVVANVGSAHESDVNSVSFSSVATATVGGAHGQASSEGVVLASGGDDNLVRLWHVVNSS